MHTSMKSKGDGLVATESEGHCNGDNTTVSHISEKSRLRIHTLSS